LQNLKEKSEEILNQPSPILEEYRLMFNPTPLSVDPSRSRHGNMKINNKSKMPGKINNKMPLSPRRGESRHAYTAFYTKNEERKQTYQDDER
jgi:hypothetical protein